MKTIRILAGIFLFSVSLNACAQSQTIQNNMQYNHMIGTGSSVNRPVFYASSKYITQKLDARSLKRIDITSIVLRITPTNKNEVSLRMPENLADLIQTEINDDRLYLKFKDNVEAHYNDIELILPYRYLEEIQIIGSGSIYLSKEMNTNHLTVSIAGSGSFKASGLKCDQKLSMNIAGSGTMSCSHIQAESLEWRISGSGNISSSQINSKECKISIAGSGNISSSKVESEKCDVSIAGSGNIHIAGIQTKELAGAVAGTGILRLEGEARKANYQFAGFGELHAENCIAQEVTAKCINGEIYCRAEQTLYCEIEHHGKVFYKGQPNVTYSKDAPQKF